MGKGGSSKVVYQTAPVVTPAIARSISKDTQSAQALQQSDRDRHNGIGATYLRYFQGRQQNGGAGKATLGGK